MKRINFNTLTQFLGRNGTGKCSGITVNVNPSLSYDPNNKTIEIAPITSKGLTGKCYIKIPRANVQELIDTLYLFVLEQSGDK